MIDIYLNVYDIHSSNKYLDLFGMGAYHTAIQINDLEISFSMKKGIYYIKLENIKERKDSIYISSIDMDENDIYMYINSFNNDFNEDTYNYLSNNCNHFTKKVIFNLLKKNIPDYINRLAYFGSCLSCLLPHEKLINSQQFNVNDFDEVKIGDLIKNGPLYF